MSPVLRRLLSVMLASFLVLLVAAPAFGYNEENVKHIRITRLDPVDCGTPIRLVADLRDKRGSAVPGATVIWSFKKQEAGDSLSPTTTASDSEGRARTTLTLSCEKGNRIVRAHVPGDGAAIITIQYNPNKAAALTTSGSDAALAAPIREAGTHGTNPRTPAGAAPLTDASPVVLAEPAGAVSGIVLAAIALIAGAALLAARRTGAFGSLRSPTA